MEKCRARQATDDTRIACWISKAEDTHSQCVILIVIPLQQWLHEGASVLRYTYTACLIPSENRSTKMMEDNGGLVE